MTDVVPRHLCLLSVPLPRNAAV